MHVKPEPFLTSLGGARNFAIGMDAATPGGIRDMEPPRSIWPWITVALAAAVAVAIGAAALYQ